MSIGVLGGGLTGVTLGRFLGSDAEILEAESQLGGLCRSAHEDGFTFDLGSHIIFSRDDQVLNFMASALGDNKVRNVRNAKVLFKGNYVKYPFENGLSDLPPEDNFECLFHYIDNLIKRSGNLPRHPDNFKSWIYHTFGKGIADKYIIPYNEKVWKIDSGLMSLDWVGDRVPEPPMEDIIRSSLGIRTEGYQHQLYFYYPRIGGIQALVESIAQGVKGRISLGFQVRSIRGEDGRWVVSDGREEKVFDEIVSTIPIFELAKALGGVPDEVVREINGLRYNSLIVVMIGLDVPRLNDLSWLYIPERSIKANRVSFPSNFSDCVAPVGRSSALVEITCIKGDSVWNMRDEEIAEDAIDDLHYLGIIDRRDVCYCRVERSRYAYVVYDLDYSRKIELIGGYFNDIGIELCGRFSEFKYLNMDGCVRSAIDKSRKLTGDLSRD